MRRQTIIPYFVVDDNLDTMSLMEIFKNTRAVLFLILLLAALLRLPFLDQLPFGITIDEAGQGYSAYSILITGRDEWGDFLPLNPRGFGDYKPPLYMYLLVPSVAIFGLSEFAVRFPAAIAGILTVWVIFFLVRELFKDRNLALIASFFIAIAPWHVYQSRLGWESNVGLLFFCLGIWLFIKGLSKGNLLGVSALSFGLSAMSYHSFKLLAPLMLAGLVIIFLKQFSKIEKKNFFSFAGVVLIFFVILSYGFIFSGAGRRASDQSVLKEENLVQLRQIQFDDKLPQPWGRILNNKYEFFISKLTDNYLGYFSLPFLFGPHRSDGSVLNFPGKGLFYIWQLPLLLLGAFYLIKKREKAGLIILFWIITAPIPASLTQDYQHSGRAQALFPAILLVSVIGIKYLFDLVKPNNLRKLLSYSAVSIVVYSVILRIDDYAFNTFNHPLGGLVQGYSDVIELTKNNYDKYEKIIFTKSWGEPQAFIAFYQKIDPITFQSASKDWRRFESEGFRFLDMIDYSLEKYDFRKVDISRDRHFKNSLIVGTPEEISPEYKTLAVFKNLEGKTTFLVVETDEIPD